MTLYRMTYHRDGASRGITFCARDAAEAANRCEWLARALRLKAYDCAAIRPLVRQFRLA